MAEDLLLKEAPWDDEEGVPRRKSALTGWLLIISGAALQIGAIAYGLASGYVEGFFQIMLMIILIVIGLILEFVGIGYMPPSGRRRNGGDSQK